MTEPIWRTGTVSSPAATSGANCTVILDEPNPQPVPAVNATGATIQAGVRVLVLFVPPHGVWVAHVLSASIYAARMYRTAAFANLGAAVVTTQVPYDTINYDVGNHLTVGAAAAYTVPAAGVYAVYAQHELQLGNNPEEFWLSVYVDGTEARRGTRLVIRGGTGGDAYGLTVSGHVSAAAGASLDIRVTHQQGGNTIAQNIGAPGGAGVADRIGFAEFFRVPD